VSTRFLCGRLALRMDDPGASVAHLKVGLEATESGDPESYALLLEAMLARALCVLGDHAQGKMLLEGIEEKLANLAIPRTTQVLVVLALAWKTLGESDRALDRAEKAVRMAGTRGFRLWSLYARMIVADVGQGEAAEVAHGESVTLARELCRSLPPELADHFRRRRGIGALLVEG